MKDKFGLDNLKKEEKKQVMSLLLVICLVGIVLLGTSYAWLSVTKEGENNVGITAGTLNLEFDDNGSDVITLAGSLPKSDSEALSGDSYNFKITNTGNIPSNYTIYMDDVELSAGESRIDDKFIKYSLTKNSEESNASLLSSITPDEKMAKQIAFSSLKEGESDTYSLRIWLDEESFNSSAAGKTLKKTLRIEATQ